MAKLRPTIMLLTASVTLGVAGCGPEDDAENEVDQSTVTTESVVSSQQETSEASVSDTSGGHGEMVHQLEGSPAPETMVAAAEPQFPVGSQVMMTADHMMGMAGTEATVVGAYDTTLYQVSYTPGNGGERVQDHKWVAYEEIEASAEPIVEGDTVTLHADHMTGMDGQEAEITGIYEGVAYMVDYVDPETADAVTNHKWLSEEELEIVAD